MDHFEIRNVERVPVRRWYMSSVVGGSLSEGCSERVLAGVFLPPV